MKIDVWFIQIWVVNTSTRIYCINFPSLCYDQNSDHGKVQVGLGVAIETSMSKHLLFDFYQSKKLRGKKPSFCETFVKKNLISLLMWHVHEDTKPFKWIAVWLQFIKEKRILN